MSLLSSLILPELEKQLVSIEPLLAQFIFQQLRDIGQELVSYVENKVDNDQNKIDKVDATLPNCL
jgi:hypothetical protein